MKSSSSARVSSVARRVSDGISPWDLSELEVPPYRHPEESARRDREDEQDPEQDGSKTTAPVLQDEELARALLRVQELEEMLESMVPERERFVREAYERGAAEGRAEAEQHEAARMRETLAAVDAALTEIRESGSRWASTLEENVCALAVAVARHILGREIDGDRLAVLGLARSAISRFGLAEPLRIRVNERDREVLAELESEGEEVATLVAGRDVIWIADPAVEVGGCVVEGPDRIVDGRLDTALERVYRRLTESHG